MRRKSKDIIVVGIGASAGGLEALQDFFKNMPNNTGIAFVVIQHLSPDYKSLMPELLSKYTNMPIKVIKDGMEVEPDTIYLITPRKNTYIFHNKLYLEEQNFKKGLNLPVDVFFKSLAIEKGNKAIGIILSGTGSDGTLGTKSIKESGGIIMAQDEQTAKFNGMPKSSIATGLVDYILPPDKMPEALINFIKHPLVEKQKKIEELIPDKGDTLTKILAILKRYSNIDFSFYKENTIIRRLERRLSINKFTTLEEYFVLLSQSDKEKELLIRDLLIGVTRFFRDKEAFYSLENIVFPELTKKQNIRIWSAGCSTGEEAYSIAILLADYIEKKNLNCNIKIFATDIDKSSIEVASKGIYSDSELSEVDPALLVKYFIKIENGYQIKEDIRRVIVFATHNLLKDSPFSKIDLIICRNLLIYIKNEYQTRILTNFYYSLNNDGYLFLGTSESIGASLNNAFECIDNKNRIYKYKEGFKSTLLKELSFSNVGYLEKNNTFLSKNFEGVKSDKLLEKIASEYLPPTIVVDFNDNIIQIINDVSQFLKIQPGKFSANLFNNLDKEMSFFVGALLRKIKTDSPEEEIIVSIDNYNNSKVILKGKLLFIDKIKLILITFIKEPIDKKEDIPEKKEKIITSDINYNRIAELERELQLTKETLKATVEELETSNEELQSSNEELIASNEELQSTNEELQSVNEELYTVNSEYQIKIEELIKLNNDMNNLLRNTEIGALYLDRNLCIRKITNVVTKLTNILENDIGRPITHISLSNIDNDLIHNIEKVSDDLIPIDKEVKIGDDKFYLIRIRPYRTEHNAIEGILVLFIDITDMKKEYEKSKRLSEKLENALEIGNMAWWEWDLKTNIVTYSDKKATMLGYTKEEFPDDVYKICELIHPEDYEQTMQAMRDYIEGKSEKWDIVYRIKRKDGTYAWYYDRGNIVERDKDGKPLKLVGTVIDISRLKTLEIELNHHKDIFKKMMDNNPWAKVMVDKDGAIIYVNKKGEEIFGLKKDEITKRYFNSKEWKITGLDGKEIDIDDLPFSIIKRTKKCIYDYKHYIESGDGKKILLNISGCPIITNDKFEGAIFSVRIENEKQ